MSFLAAHIPFDSPPLGLRRPFLRLVSSFATSATDAIDKLLSNNSSPQPSVLLLLVTSEKYLMHQIISTCTRSQCLSSCVTPTLKPCMHLSPQLPSPRFHLMLIFAPSGNVMQTHVCANVRHVYLLMPMKKPCSDLLPLGLQGTLRDYGGVYLRVITVLFCRTFRSRKRDFWTWLPGGFGTSGNH